MIREQVEQQIEIFGRVYTHSWGKKHERTVRKVISEQRKKGVILLPVGQREYVHIDRLSDIEAEQFLQSQINHLVTQYQNTIRPLKNRTKDKQLQKLMGGLESVMEET